MLMKSYPNLEKIVCSRTVISGSPIENVNKSGYTIPYGETKINVINVSAHYPNNNADFMDLVCINLLYY